MSSVLEDATPVVLLSNCGPLDVTKPVETSNGVEVGFNPESRSSIPERADETTEFWVVENTESEAVAVEAIELSSRLVVSDRLPSSSMVEETALSVVTKEVLETVEELDESKTELEAEVAVGSASSEALSSEDIEENEEDALIEELGIELEEELGTELEEEETMHTDDDDDTEEDGSVSGA